MITRATNEFEPDTSGDGQNQGDVLITDVNVLIRPPAPGQLYHVAHNSFHATKILNLANHGDEMRWHIATDLAVEAAHQLLRQVYYAYLNMLSFELWVDAYIFYIGADGEVVQQKHEGMTDQPAMTHRFYVYTQDFWDDGTAERSDWSEILEYVLTGGGLPTGLERVAHSDIEEVLGHLEPGDAQQRIVVVRPDESAPDGYSARGFRV